MVLPPHNFFEPPDDVVNPTPDPHQDEVAAIHPRRSPVTAFVGLACSLAGLCALYFGRSAATAAAVFGAGGIVLSVVGLSSSRKSHRPAGLAIAGLLIGLAVVAVTILLLR